MKTIGLIGEMSWESSYIYYRIINEEVMARLGGLHSAKCILYSFDFYEIEEFQRKGEWGKAAEILIKVARTLENAEVDFIVICTNTMHKVSGEVAAATNIPLLHIADMTAEKILSDGIKTIGLLGTKYTMEQDFYKSRIEMSGIKVIVPNENDREIVIKVIYQELCIGQIKEESRNHYLRIIKDLIEKGAEGVILGCTEIGLLVQQKDTTVPLYDTTILHAVGAVDHAL
jgi:aspartate racemase